MNEKTYEERLLDNMTRIVNSLGDGGSYDNPDETTYEGKMLNRTDKIADILENGGGGGGLPEVTDADDGKVLTVIDGAWAAGEGGGGGLLVHINFPENPEEPATLDKNWNEINAVVQSGISPVFIANGVIYTCIEVIYDNAYIVTLVDLADGSARALPFVADSATGVLTYAPEL